MNYINYNGDNYYHQEDVKHLLTLLEIIKGSVRNSDKVTPLINEALAEFDIEGTQPIMTFGIDYGSREDLEVAKIVARMNRRVPMLMVGASDAYLDFVKKVDPIALNELAPIIDEKKFIAQMDYNLAKRLHGLLAVKSNINNDHSFDVGEEIVLVDYLEGGRFRALNARLKSSNISILDIKALNGVQLITDYIAAWKDIREAHTGQLVGEWGTPEALKDAVDAFIDEKSVFTAEYLVQNQDLIAESNLGDLVLINPHHLAKHETLSVGRLLKVIEIGHAVKCVDSSLSIGLVHRNCLIPAPLEGHDIFKYNLLRRILGIVTIVDNRSNHSFSIGLTEGVIISHNIGVVHLFSFMDENGVVEEVYRGDFQPMAGYGRFVKVLDVGQMEGLLGGDILRLFTDEDCEMYSYKRVTDDVEGAISSIVFEKAQYHEVWDAYAKKFNHILNPTE